jgi:hypothetical protein
MKGGALCTSPQTKEVAVETGQSKVLLIAATMAAVLLLLLAGALAGGGVGSSEGHEGLMQAEPKVRMA